MSSAQNKTQANPKTSLKKKKLKINSKDSAEKALRHILEVQLEELTNSIDGVITDKDAEFLHVFRVAIRRSRSALGQLKGVLSRSLEGYFLGEMKWVGTMTTPCRDLDVFIHEMKDHLNNSSLKGLVNLNLLFKELDKERINAHQTVLDCLKSDRFKQLLSNWEILTKYPQHHLPECPNAKMPIKELSAKRILKIYQKMVTSGSKLGNNPSADKMHNLRINGKKLRYLLEFFRSLYPKQQTDSLISELKDFQDILGGNQDMAVQKGRLIIFSKNHKKMLKENPEFATSISSLREIIQRKQKEYQQQFHAKFEIFSSKDSQAEYMSLFGELHFR